VPAAIAVVPATVRTRRLVQAVIVFLPPPERAPFEK